MARNRILVTGGSTIHGLGYDGNPFGARAAELLEADDVIDLSAVSLTCRGVLDQHQATIAEFAADVAIVMVGGTESLMRPGLRLQALLERYAPRTWHGVAGLEPRARYSRNRWKRMRQAVQTSLKLALKTVLFRALRGGAAQLPFPVLTTDATELLLHVANHSGHVVVVGLPPIDSKMFPGTAESFQRTNAVLGAIAAAHPKISYLQLDGLLDQWDDFLADHLHLARNGHEKVAAALARAIVLEEQRLPT